MKTCTYCGGYHATFACDERQREYNRQLEERAVRMEAERARRRSCPYCGGPHAIDVCQAFLGMFDKPRDVIEAPPEIIWKPPGFMDKPQYTPQDYSVPDPDWEGVDLAVEQKPLVLMPPAPGKCSMCATEHPEDQPHNQQSLFWQYWFYAASGSKAWPTWWDAMAHCTDDVKRKWIKELAVRGVVVPVPKDFDGQPATGRKFDFE